MIKNLPFLRRVIGTALIVIGIAALITPLTPGAWLAVVGLEMLGIRFLFWERVKKQWRKLTNSVSAQEEAFDWIIGILKRHKIPFVISGGLAARAYGSKRGLRDFDFDIANDGFEKILSDVRPYITAGPEKHISRAFENTLLELTYREQKIDIAGASDAKIFNRATDEWSPDETDLTRYEMKYIFGTLVPVMLPTDLLEYKSKSPRPEDLEDIEAIKRYLKKRLLSQKLTISRH